MFEGTKTSGLSAENVCYGLLFLYLIKSVMNTQTKTSNHTIARFFVFAGFFSIIAIESSSNGACKITQILSHNSVWYIQSQAMTVPWMLRSSVRTGRQKYRGAIKLPRIFAVSAADYPILPAAAKALFYVIERTRMSAIRCAACPSP